MTTEQTLQFVGGGIFCTLCLFLLCFLVWVYRRRRHTHPEQHFRTLILFPWVQLVGAVGLCIALFSNATSSDTQAYQLALRDLFVLVPLVVFRFGLVVVAFFWSQLHHEFRNARFGRDFMPPFSRRTYILAMAVAVWILFCMGAVLVTFNASDLVVSVVLYLSFYPVFSAGVLIGFFRTFRMISGDLKVVVKGFSVQQSEYFTQVRWVFFLVPGCGDGSANEYCSLAPAHSPTHTDTYTRIFTHTYIQHTHAHIHAHAHT